ncbi:MAG: oxidoreductase, partial [Spirochaetaceae bacterium]|nr:oxidoreductase [Spirochaetaceae bacterium]
MSKLCVNLPPFAPDYSGVASVLFELGGMVVIHDASGCTGNYLGYDEPRWLGSKALVFCSGLRHMDAILGNDNLLIDRIIAAVNDTHPKFVALLGSPVPMVIGTDYEGIATE